MNARATYPINALVMDTQRNKLGRVMGHFGTCLQLRAPGGGREWDADPDCVRTPTPNECLHAEIVEKCARPAPGRRSP